MTTVPFDPELLAGLAFFQREIEGTPLRTGNIHASRARFAALTAPIEAVVGDAPVAFEHVSVPGPAGAPDVALTVIRPAAGTSGAAGVYNIHGGGTVLGNRFFGVGELIDLVVRHGVVAVTVEYRLAPEDPYPAGVEDCYAGLVWMAGHAAELGIDPARIVVQGASAGGLLSAAVSLLARDRSGPAIAGQILVSPMLDDRNDAPSTHQFDDVGVWDRGANHAGWTAYLGDARGSADVPAYAAPARATDLSGLPPAFIELGACEALRDEDISYASRIWAAGGQAELHIWQGAFHGSNGIAPGAEVSRATDAARLSWMRRILAL
ncbi:alpha/beta hydrolase [Specibacter cremeus]|uniref:alpha/beta hydrolase n=1 Tax=Specibacter cremeus TaxID=1629051 RepID=UPI000F7A8AAC|nr:alpha/beta hydrolase [Specibacter cremeus]